MTTETTDKQLGMLLDFIKQHRGVDFSGYKRGSLQRRILKRVHALSLDDLEAYLDYLEVHPEEFGHLFDTVLINVTGFLRDGPAWTYLNTEIIPRILAEKAEDEPIRVWSAGCASGEEAYSIAMLLAEQLGIEGFKRRVKIYATDMDEDALNQARLAAYSAKDVENMPPELLEKYFDPAGSQYVFQKELRRSVIFGRHDLMQDAPISRVDLLICRNVLMYFNAEAQSKVLTRLHFALNENGFMFLGKAEMLLTHTNLFSPVELKHRVFMKNEQTGLHNQLVTSKGGARNDGLTNFAYTMPRLREIAFDANIVAQVVVDTNGSLVLANEMARQLFGLASGDLGNPFQDLRLSYQPMDLRSAIEQSMQSGEALVIKEVLWRNADGQDRYLNITVKGLYSPEQKPIGTAISFLDVSQHKRLQQQLEHANHELETAMEELESTNEEMETTNEELQSTIEELETTNEELQSTNEELETMNEELQSTNEELETMNDEMTQRTNELNHVNHFMQSILTSLRGGVIVIDRDYLIEIWNTKSEDLWGLRQDEVIGRSLFSLDIGLPVEKMKRPIINLISKEGETWETTLNATNRRGKPIDVRIVALPLVEPLDAGGGAIIIVEPIQQEVPSSS